MWRKVAAALAAFVVATVVVAQTPKPESKPAAAKPKARSGPPLPHLFAQRADVISVLQENGGSFETEAAVSAGLDWLARHQEKDGSWSCEKFRDRCSSEGYKCGGRGVPLYDVGVSALALLAFLASNNHEQGGRHRDVVANGIRWLKSQQDAKGCYPTTEDHRYPYMHAMATLAMVENAVLSGSPAARESAQKGLDFIVKLQSPQQRGWRYAEKPADSDSTVTAWMTLALKAGQAGNVRSHDGALRGGSEFIRKITDEKTFRTGYVAKGDLPFRFDGQKARFSPGESESLTACGMTVRLFCGDDPRSGLTVGQARVCLEKLPEWGSETGRIDFFYWHFATLAMFQVGGDEWKAWFRKLKEAALSAQQKGAPEDSCQRGSFDPHDPWGTQGGRIYATAMMTLCLETPYRYARFYQR